MKITEIKSIIEKQMALSPANRVTICLRGQQGIGKTQVIKQVCDEHGWKYRVLYGAQAAVEDLMGLPKIQPVLDANKNPVLDEYQMPVTYTTFAKPVLLPDEEKTVFVLEELNRAPLEVQQAVLQLFTDRKIGSHTLPDNIILMVSINPANEAYMTQDMDPVLLNRMCTIDIEADRRDFISYAIRKQFHDDVVAYIGNLNEADLKYHFAAKPSSEDIGKPLPSPRSWEMVSNILKMGFKRDEAGLERSLIMGVIGETTATNFLHIRDKNFKTPVRGKQVLENYPVYAEQACKQNDNEQYFTMTELAAYICNAKTYKEIMKTPLQEAHIKNVCDYLCDLKNFKSLRTTFFNLVDHTQQELFYTILVKYQAKYPNKALIQELLMDSNNMKKID